MQWNNQVAVIPLYVLALLEYSDKSACSYA